MGVEFAIAGAGSAILGRRGRNELISAWVAIVVGLHFVPLAWLLRFPLLGVMGVVMAVAAVAGVRVARRRGLTVSAVVGLGCGTILLATGLFSLAVALA